MTKNMEGGSLRVTFHYFIEPNYDKFFTLSREEGGPQTYQYFILLFFTL